MLRTHTNTTDADQHIFDVNGEPIKVAPGESEQYLDADSRPASIDGLIVAISDDDVYIGYAQPGTAENALGWIIKKKVSAGGVTKYLLAEGQWVLRYRFDLRASYNYN